MAFDQKTRNLLQRTVTACRRVLDREFTAQLQELYGIQPDGSLAPTAALDHLGDESLEIARLLRERINHLEGGKPSEALTRTAAKPEHIARVIREQAFTVLNRLAALRLCEERGLVLECVRKGVNSEGFQLFKSSAGSALGETHEAYRVYLHCLFDELALDLGVLFDRFSPLALLFPRHAALAEVLNELNGSGKAAERDEIPPEQFAEIWQADETVGWIYQYYNDETERKKMREESSAPRNSRELAVRNQFFTPRYVVEFLTDNTLGRIWYEMSGGATSLKEKCRYLVRRPDEVFLGDLTDAKAEHPQEGIIAMVRLLIEGRESDFSTFNSRNLQPLIDLGHTVNGYQRLPGSETLWGGWFEEATRAASRGEYLPRTTQEILDLLFIVCRNDRATDGTMSGEQWFVGLANEVRRRALRSREANLSQEDLLKQPVHIPHRPLKDPRTILMLDPACGSMHFGLYAFDLFEVIYDEAWALEEKLGADALSRPPGMKSLHDTYAGKDAFLKDVPRLIIEHNLHGIDIDPRCAQIAGLSLWLRAQKAWQRLGLKPAERPAIKRSNIVCAEPMPGEKELLREFVEREFPAAERAVCLRLLEAIFDKMQLAGEAGSLLKIEEEIRSAIEDARDAWQKLATKPPELFTTTELNQISTAPELTGLEQAVSSLTTDPRHLTTDFWERIEERIYAALRDYAEQAENGGGFQRRLFAEDTARGFAFIDVCRKRYDVVLMNPPFGTSSESAKDYIFNNFDREKIELGACFVGAHLKKLASGGCVGVIANRTMLFSRTFEDWRRSALSGLLLCADFGDGVLDALVETAAFTVTNKPCSQSVFFKLLDATDKGSELQNCTVIRPVALSERRIFNRPLSAFAAIDGCVFAYWLPDSLLTKFTTMPKAANRKLVARSGLQTCDNFRFLRLAWEIPFADGDVVESWPRLTKGGDYQPFWSDTPLLINWHHEGSEVKVFIDQLYGQWSKQIPSVNLYRFPGATYTERTTSAISLRVLPRNCLFDKKGPFIGFPDGSLDQSVVLQFIALSYTTPIKAIIESSVGLRDATASGSPARDYLPSLIERLCFPHLPADVATEVATASRVCVLRHRAIEAGSEVSAVWSPMNACSMHASLSALARSELRTLRGRLSEIYAAFMTIEERSLLAFGVTRAEAGSLRDILGESVFQFENSECEVEADVLNALANLSEDQLVDVVAGSHGMSPATLKQAFVGDRLTELLSFHFRRHPLSILRKLEALQIVADSHKLATAVAVASEALGFAFGRWDIRYATGEQAAPELPDPFAPLPVCPPGQLQNAQGLPARPEDVPAAYPVRIPWDGILVDDPNHPLDLERRVREVIEIIWKPSTLNSQPSTSSPEAIEHEACEILGVKSLRDYFRKPAGFFADHLKRYSKSRRQAPIYWPLSTASGSYTLWIYYHRLTPDTLYKCVQQFVNPKLADVEKELTHLRTILAANEGGAKERKRLEELEDLRRELIELRTELELWAPKWKPNLNDGVLITAAPLWKLFRLPKWQKDLKACWQELERGDYDWANLAYTLRPDQVRVKCKTDRSLAIAHGLEELCEIKAPEKKAKKAKKKKTDAELELEGGGE